MRGRTIGDRFPVNVDWARTGLKDRLSINAKIVEHTSFHLCMMRNITSLRSALPAAARPVVLPAEQVF